MSINEACPSVSTIPIVIPSAQRLKPVSNPDLWEYNPEELVRFTPLRKFSRQEASHILYARIGTKRGRGPA